MPQKIIHHPIKQRWNKSLGSKNSDCIFLVTSKNCILTLPCVKRVGCHVSTPCGSQKSAHLTCMSLTYVDMSNLGASHSIQQDIYRSIVLVCKNNQCLSFYCHQSVFLFEKSQFVVFKFILWEFMIPKTWRHVQRIQLMAVSIQKNNSLPKQTDSIPLFFRWIHISHLKKKARKNHRFKNASLVRMGY